ncbi:SpoIIE family protein phosphatase [Streptomyces sp. AF1A]|uniref:SpoIIE family protein phosphatase n=1 Tax=Streptomyces sp. AF1A TaxID=3394350 RepID=UPI0039BC63D8
MLGYAAHQVLGQHLDHILATPSPSFQRSAKSPDSWTGFLSFRAKSGEDLPLWVRTQRAAVVAGGPPWSFLSFRLPVDVENEEIDEAVLRWLYESAPMALTVYGKDLRCLRKNAAMVRLTGSPNCECLDEISSQTLTGDGGVEWEAELCRALAEGSEITSREVRTPVPDSPDRERVFVAAAGPMFDSSDRAVGLCSTLSDVTEQRRARQRLMLLSEASERIGTTLDVSVTARELVDLLCPQLSDWCHLDLLDSMLRGEEPGPFSDKVALRRGAHSSVRPGAPETTSDVGEVAFYPAHSPPVQSMIMNRTIVLSSGDPEMAAWLAEDPRRARRFKKYGWCSVMVTPVGARGAVIGVVVLFRNKQGAFTDDDRLLIEELVSRAAVCLDNARRYTRERATALALQQSLLPHTRTDQTAVQTAGRYRPADSHVGVGGDWFDVIPLSGKRVALVVGDVVGHGISAAATMGRLRTAVRTLADVDLPPDELLTHLDDVLTRLRTENRHPEASGDVGATCTYAVYDPVSQVCSIASAGHPPPAVVPPSGTTTFLDAPCGPPLGVGGLPFECTELALPAGTVLALYSNGVLHAHDHDVDLALNKLGQVLRTPGLSLDELCEETLRQLLPPRPTDDAALLLARTRALGAEQVAVLDVPRQDSFVAEARSWTARHLDDWGLVDSGYITELLVSELVTNAIRYGRPPIQLRLIRDQPLICEVFDGSSTAPHMRRARLSDEGGRGLLLVAQLTERWGTRHSRRGKTIWCEQRVGPHQDIDLFDALPVM